MKEKDIIKTVVANDFAMNNGRVIRNINVLKGKWVNLETIKATVIDLSVDELKESFNYLQIAGYIDVRDVLSKRDADISDCRYMHTEARLSEKGVRLAKYIITDKAVRV